MTHHKNLSALSNDVINIVATTTTTTPQAVAAALGEDSNTVASRMWHLANAGYIARLCRGLYTSIPKETAA